ncbi:MAG: single-stranded DNA-binding protein [Planctomycetia bacterium]|nr:single-stranded DNA-binding protein [Planctomycetia bacterium]
MANLNKVMLIGRLTRDPEAVTFSNGGKVAKFGFAVNNNKRNAQTGEWEKVPVFLDVEAYNRQEGRQQLADRVLEWLRKGHQVYLEGHLHMDQWTDKNDGSKRSKLKIVLDNLQTLERPDDGAAPEGGGTRPAYRGNAPARSAPRGGYSGGGSSGSYGGDPEPMEPPPEPLGDDGNIPF